MKEPIEVIGIDRDGLRDKWLPAGESRAPGGISDPELPDAEGTKRPGLKWSCDKNGAPGLGPDAPTTSTGWRAQFLRRVT
jgi:hypothetical protein